MDTVVRYIKNVLDEHSIMVEYKDGMYNIICLIDCYKSKEMKNLQLSYSYMVIESVNKKLKHFLHENEFTVRKHLINLPTEDVVTFLNK